MALLPFIAGVWYLVLAAGVVTGSQPGSVGKYLFAFAGIVLVVAGVRIMAGRAPAVRTARWAAALALAVAMVPVILVLFTLAATGDIDRLRLAAGELGRAFAGIVPAVIVLLGMRKERKPGSSANG